MGMGAAKEVGRSTVIGANGAVKGEEKGGKEGVGCLGEGSAPAEEEEEEAPLSSHSSPATPVATAADIERDEGVAATAKLDSWSHSPSAATLEVMEGGGGCTRAERHVANRFDTL